MNPLMMDSTTLDISREERRTFCEKIRDASNEKELCSDTQAVLDEFSYAFSVCNRELTETNRVEIDISSTEWAFPIVLVEKKKRR